MSSCKTRHYNKEGSACPKFEVVVASVVLVCVDVQLSKEIEFLIGALLILMAFDML